MAKKLLKLTNLNKFGVVLIMIMAVLVFLAVLARIAFQIQLYDYAAEQAGIVSIRELIINAVDELKTDAPVDPKTGDIYFPEAKLYLPSNLKIIRLTYAYESNGENGEELSISNRLILNQDIAKLYGARNINEVFDGVPKLQSCQRGVKFLYKQPKEMASDLKKSIHLNNGRDLYAYLEKSCPELNESMELLSNIKAY